MVTVCNINQHWGICKIWRYYTGFRKDTSLMGCKAVSLGNYSPTFRSTLVKHLSESESKKSEQRSIEASGNIYPTTCHNISEGCSLALKHFCTFSTVYLRVPYDTLNQMLLLPKQQSQTGLYKRECVLCVVRAGVSYNIYFIRTSPLY